jgi:uncharacterized protein (TIGR02246 family)
MRRLESTVGLVFGLATLAFSHVALAEPTADEAAIRQIIASWDQGWKTFDAALATRDYAADADWTNAFGVSKKGQPEIHRFLADLYKSPGIPSRHSTPSTTTLRFIRPDIVRR